MDDNWTKLLLGELKRIIKAQGYNYKDISKALKMSESGFKKLINSEDCSLSKVEKICNFIGIRMTDLFRSIEELQLEEVSFSKGQELFFESERVGFLLFWLLVYERRSLVESQKLLNLEEKKMWSLLRKMDVLNLIKVLPGDRLGLPRPQGIKWVGKSKFINDLYRQWGSTLLNNAIGENANDLENSYFTIRYLKMCESTWKEFKLNLESLELQYTNTATREMRMNVQNLKHIRWLSIADQKSWAEDEISRMK
jgi:transcriptional regulator with XRE-family HTH domain